MHLYVYQASRFSAEQTELNTMLHSSSSTSPGLYIRESIYIARHTNQLRYIIIILWVESDVVCFIPMLYIFMQTMNILLTTSTRVDLLVFEAHSAVSFPAGLRSVFDSNVREPYTACKTRLYELQLHLPRCWFVR